MPTSPGAPPQEPLPQVSSKVRILHLEDNQHDAALIKAVIDGASDELAATVRTVYTKKAYLAALKSGGIDLILSDHRMPGYDGNAALKDAKTLCPDAPFIMVTGELGEERAVETLKAGATDYVMKDRIRRLVPSIKRALRDAALERERRQKEALIARQITELAKAHQELSAIVDGMTEGLTIFDMKGNILRRNAQAAAVLGYGQEADNNRILPRSKDIFEVFRLDGTPMPAEEWPISKMLRGEEVKDCIATVHRRDTGMWKTLSHNGSIICDDTGNPLYAILTYRDVTEQVHAQEMLRHKEEELREAQRMAHVGSWYWNARTDEVTVSDEIFNLYGLDSARPFPNLKEQEGTLLPPKSWKLVSEAIDQMVKTGKPFELDLEVIHCNGDTLWIIARGEVVRNAEGELLGIRGTVQEITERKRAEEALHRQAQLIDLSPDAIMIRAVDGCIEFWSKGAEALYGWTLGDALGQKSHVLLKTSSSGPLEEIIRETIQTGRWSGELTHTTKDGRRVIVQSRWLAQCDAKGTVQGILESNLDITEGKLAEMALRESEERFRTMADSTPVMIWVTDTLGEIEFVNHAYEEFFGVTEAQVKGPSSWKMLMHPDDAESYVAAYVEALQTHGPFDAEARVMRGTGEWRWVHSYCLPRFSGEGKFLGHVGSSPDITEQKRAADALKVSVENLRLMVSQASEAMMVIDSDGRIEALSSLGSRILGYEEGELVGQQIDQFAETFSRLEASLTLENLRKGAPRPMTNSLRVRTKSGTMQWMSVTGNVVNLGAQGEKYFVKFQTLELPAPRNSSRHGNR